MSRKPITEFVGGKGPRQCIWEAVRRLHAANPKQPIDHLSLRAELPREQRRNVSPSAISDYLRNLQAAGFLAEVAAAVIRKSPTTYLLVRDAGLEAPRVRRDGTQVTQGLAQEQMWRTLRLVTRDTNARELAAHASTKDVAVDEAAARAYLCALDRAGYLDVTAQGKGTGAGGVQSRYRLRIARNTGPRPPMICRTKVIYDPNEDRVVYAPRVTDEDAIYGQ